MNDLMSAGLHRLWKRFTVAQAGLRPGMKVLDVAGGTADLTRLFLKEVGETGQVFLTDINFSMLREGRDLHQPVATAMTTPVLSVPAATDFRSAFRLLVQQGLRHLVVTDDSGDVEPGPDCWVSMSGVTALWRANDAREYVVFPLSMSPAWTVLRSWAAQVQLLDQKAFIRTLVQVFDVDAALVAPWRKLDFLSSVKTAGEVERGRDRLGREINNQASGAVDLPETLPVTVPIFREQGQRETYTVLCKVEIDAAANRIGLLVKDSDLSAIEESHLAGILGQLREELTDVPCYLGHVL
jgi:CBS domain-containing protein